MNRQCKVVGGKLSADRTDKRPEPMSADDSALAQIALRLVDTVLSQAVQDALREAYQLGFNDGRKMQ